MEVVEIEEGITALGFSRNETCDIYENYYYNSLMRAYMQL